MKNRRKMRTHNLKGIGKIVLTKDYSFKWKGDILYLLLNGKKGVKGKWIHSFPKGVTIYAIKKWISDYEANLQKKKKKENPSKELRDYCAAPASICHQYENCDKCNENDKEWALERRKKGEKIIRPGPEDISEERTILSSSRPKKILSKKSYSGGWK